MLIAHTRARRRSRKVRSRHVHFVIGADGNRAAMLAQEDAAAAHQVVRLEMRVDVAPMGERRHVRQQRDDNPASGRQ